MTDEQLAQWRMRSLRLTGSSFETPSDVVRWLGAVQSQDYGPAKWALGQRTRGSTDASVDDAFRSGNFLRTHVLRPTWHFVLPEDIRWLLALTGPRVHGLNSYYYRRSELDDAALTRATDLIVAAVGDGNHRTRLELESLLECSGISTPKGFRMAYILMHGELHGIICSGVPRGKQQTYALLDERAPLASSRQLSHEEGLAELTRRYFTSHGPATPKDLRWWSSLTLSAIKTGLALAGDALQHREVNGVTYWFGEAEPDTAPSRPAVHLLQAYDEYLVGHSETKYVLDVAGVARWTTQERFVFNLIAVLDSQVIGHWRRTPKRDAVTIEVALYRELDAAQTIALRAAADAHGAFLGLPACLEVSMIEASRAARHAR